MCLFHISLKKTFIIVIILLSIFTLFLYWYNNNINKFHNIFDNLEEYDVKTVPYDNEIKFVLSTEDILNGIEKQREITKINDTLLYLSEIEEKVNNINNEPEIYITIGMAIDSKRSQHGTVLTMHSIEEANNNLITKYSVILKAFDDKTKPGSFEKGYGDSTGEYYEEMTFIFSKSDIKNSEEWSFSVSGLNLLTYNKK